ncbi:MAG: undecaprenyldiphospho-muramoylpentapeptide beta-N-acetylglucosaminyltransferase [Clostridia bacterium]|nr:undecaprenyldiphospho-muramoylpentapeptide beta-N-acetylglucosaminyltransferase [Clostridia bacterium]
MRAIVTGGGTGGHIYPALAIADKIKEEEPGSEILYIGNDLGLEKDIVPKTGYDFKMVDARWLLSASPKELFLTSISVMKGRSQALKLMKEFKPDVVIGTGGFVCVPVVLAGKKYGARTFIHEQNAYPGKANRLLEGVVDKIFLGFKDASRYFKKPEKHVYAGNPVRKCFFEMDKEKARAELGISKDDFVLFVFGGSQGSEEIDKAFFPLLEKFSKEDEMTTIFGTGDYYYEDIQAGLREKGIDLGDKVIMKAYFTDMEKYMAASDLIVGRSGALSVAETTASGKAAIFIPSPNVTANHQFFNAKVVADRGGAFILEEKDMTSEKLEEEILKIKNDSKLLEEMSKASLSCSPKEATDIIYSNLKK